MTQKQTAEKISFLLLSKNEIAMNWTQAPLVMHLPFMGLREEFFLEVAIHPKDISNSQESLISECIQIAKLICNAKILVEEKGLEISAYASDKKYSRRICRLLVFNRAFDKLNEVQFDDVFNQRVDGITFQVPIRSA